MSHNIRYERFTDRARKIVELAELAARQLKHPVVGSEHLLLGMLIEGTGVAGAVLKNLGVDLDKTRSEIQDRQPAMTDELSPAERVPMDYSAKKVFEHSMEECKKLGHNYIGTEHLLLGLCRLREGLAAHVLHSFGLKLDDIREEVLNLLGHGL